MSFIATVCRIGKKIKAIPSKNNKNSGMYVTIIIVLSLLVATFCDLVMVVEGFGYTTI